MKTEDNTYIHAAVLKGIEHGWHRLYGLRGFFISIYIIYKVVFYT
jgi:hypothetical protein